MSTHPTAAHTTRRRNVPEAPSSSSSYVVRSVSRSGGGDLFCFCGLQCDLQRARTSQNYGKRFYGCPMYRENNSCGFFRWLDSTNDVGILVGKHIHNEDLSSVAMQRQLDSLEQELVMLRQEMLAHINSKHGSSVGNFVKWAVLILVVMMLVYWMIWAMKKRV